MLGSILNDQYRSGVAEAAPSSAPAGLVDAAQQSLGAALGIASKLGDRGSALADGARISFVDGLANAFLVSAGALVLCAVIFAVTSPAARTTDGQPEEHRISTAPGYGRRK